MRGEAGTPPLELLVEERCELMKGEDQTRVRKLLMEKWQKRWQECKEEAGYYLTQCLTGRGIFNNYRKMTKKTESDIC